MAVGAFVPLAVFILIVGSVGFRLTALWRRTRQVPEGLLGVGLLVISGSMPLTAVGRVPGVAMETPGRLAFAAGLLGLWVGITLLMTFHYRVFRQGSGMGRVALGGFALVTAGAVVQMAAANFAGKSVETILPLMKPGTLTLMTSLLLGFAAAAFDSLRYGAALQRRETLGMADPVLVDRFRLWGASSAASAVLMLVIIGCVLAGMTIVREPVPLAAIAAAGVVMSSGWYLTFFAPESYQRFVRQRAARRS